jgi:transglutaminase-like putative cysteine protease
MNLEPYLQESNIINYSHPKIAALAKELAKGCSDDAAIAKNCFEYIRDNIRHTGDYQDSITTLKASEVLEEKTGWCYAKSHLLAALLRANGIPTGFCYQRLSCDEYRDNIYCLHGLNAIYLEKYGWYKVDARGNKEGVDAQFSPPLEKLAFELQANEYDLEEIYNEPLEKVVATLQRNDTYEKMINDFPDIKGE